MTEDEKTTVRDKRSYLSVKNLNLDPNNYRFINLSDYHFVEDDKLTLAEVQRRTYNFIIGKNAENIKDLIDSFKKNGYLPVDQIQVRQLNNGKYLVVEGNRRVACLNYLQIRYEKEGFDLGKLDPAIFSKLPVVYYTDPSDADHLILMGLKHISGNKKWPTINQAILLRDLSDKFSMSADDICQSIGISKQEFIGIINTLALIDDYQNSIYSNQFSSDKYSFFREIVKSPKLKKWLQWNDDARKAENRDNLNRLFSWLSKEPSEVISDDEDETNINESNLNYEPVLARAAQIRELAKIIEDENALDILDQTRNLTHATLASDVLSKDKTKNAISTIDNEVSILFELSAYITEPERQKINELSNKLHGIVEINHTQDLSSGIRPQNLFERPKIHFSSINIENFRRFKNVKFFNLSRINIIAGINNSGKTTALEAIKFLSSLNDPNNLVDIVCRRGKQSTTHVDMNWFVEQLPFLKINGIFDNANIKLSISHIIDKQIDDAQYYLKSSQYNFEIDGKSYESKTHFYEKYQSRTIGQIWSLCPSIFSSPFSLHDISTIEDCFSKSIKTNSRETIVEFIQKNMDPKVKNIELDQNHRFIVIHEFLKPNLDLTLFGEGLQRIFKIGLIFAYAENGIVIIDEFENAIHSSVLSQFVKLIDNLSERFNVQVFLTTHSKECIEAFVMNNEIKKESISAYSLVNINHAIEVEQFSGKRLTELMKTFDFDIRGGKIE